MDWSKWKRYYGVKLRVAAFIFGLIGWFLVFVSIFWSHFEQQLLGLQTVTGNDVYNWDKARNVLGYRFNCEIPECYYGEARRAPNFVLFPEKSLRYSSFRMYVLDHHSIDLMCPN